VTGAVRPLAGIVAGEAITSLGESAAETSLFLRAGIENVGASDFIDAQGQRVQLCACPALPPDLPGPARLLALAAHAIRALHVQLPADAAARGSPAVVLCLPERMAAGGDSLALNEAGRAFVDALHAHLPSTWREPRIEALPLGRAAGAAAMQRALQLLDSHEVVLWGGVDTLLDWAVLEGLERDLRLMTTGNIDAVRPGEAAAFLALVRAGAGQASVLAAGTGREPQPLGAEAPCLSAGFTEALDVAAAPLRAAGRRCRTWLLDATHEACATHEVQNLIGRFGDVLGADSELRMPLKELGDVGAAAMPLLAVLALQAWRQGVARDRCALVTGGSDAGLRGALLLVSRRPGATVDERAGEEVAA
jgi:3-oxoacyl-[acyl-carrier-protein] synthase-1